MLAIERLRSAVGCSVRYTAAHSSSDGSRCDHCSSNVGHARIFEHIGRELKDRRVGVLTILSPLDDHVIRDLCSVVDREVISIDDADQVVEVTAVETTDLAQLNRHPGPPSSNH